MIRCYLANKVGYFDMIMRETSPIAVLGGGPVLESDLSLVRAISPILVAVDRGATTALEHGVIPDAVIGDMDSISEETLKSIPAAHVHKIAEQETTDFEKCLIHVKAPLLLCVGFTGDRLDHELAAFNAIVKHPEQAIVLIGTHDVVFRLPRHLQLHLAIGSRFSIFPMRKTRGTSQGLRWPIDGLKLAPWSRIGVSNEVANSPIDLRISRGEALAILPKAALPEVMTALKPRTEIQN